MIRIICLLAALSLAAAGTWADEPGASGPPIGAKPGPYSFVLSTGANRGQPQCYICETAALPAVVVFARDPSTKLGKLAAQLDRALDDHKAAQLRSWVTFLSDDQVKLDATLVKWSQQHGLKRLPVGTFEDAGGPPTYRLARDTDVTVVMFVKHKVVRTFAFRTGELSEEAVTRVMQALPEILTKK
jgi:hypothetical protein